MPRGRMLCGKLQRDSAESYAVLCSEQQTSSLDDTLLTQRLTLHALLHTCWKVPTSQGQAHASTALWLRLNHASDMDADSRSF